MKRSLGRRSSSRNPRGTAFNEYENSRQDRKSGIPIRRAASTDRNLSNFATPLSGNMAMFTPMSKRSTSEDRNSALTYSARSQGFGGGTERPSRANTLSFNSARHSSYGGARSKRDNRPIEDKDWQLATQRKIENFLMQDDEGCHLLVNGSIKPITVKIFLSIVDLLLRRLDGNEDKVYIHKDNYITELPFVMKKLLYRGKMERSWLISVNTARSWCHVLACIDFLVSCVISQMVIDHMDVMFPEQYDKDDDEIWNYKVLMPYFQKSYSLYRSNIPNYEELQKELDREVIENHVANENIFDDINKLQNDIKRIVQERESMSLQYEKLQHSLQELGEIFNNLKDEKSKYEECILGSNRFIEESKSQLENMNKYLERLSENLERTRKKKTEMEKTISNQQLSQHQLAELRQKRDSLQREIKREEEYISTYEELVHQNSLEVLCQKKKIDELTKKYNIEAIKYLPFEFENIMLDAKQDEEEMNKRLTVVQEAINSAKVGFQSLSDSDCNQLVQQVQDELEMLERKYSDMKTKMKSTIDKNNNVLKEKEELILKTRQELDCLSEKISNLLNDPEEQCILAEKQKLADKMERQLSTLRSKAVSYTTECQQLIEEYSEKHKALDEEHKQFLKRMVSKSFDPKI